MLSQVLKQYWIEDMHFVYGIIFIKMYWQLLIHLFLYYKYYIHILKV